MSAIEIKRIVEPQRIHGFRMAAAIIAGLLLLAMLLSGFQPLAVFLILLMGGLLGLVALFPVAQLVRNSRGKVAVAELGAKARVAMVTAIGSEPVAIDTCGSLSKERKAWLSASGIAWDGSRLWILDSGEVTSFTPDMIRWWTWRTRKAARTRIYGGGTAALGARIQVMGDNGEARADAFRDSGFFVTVTDLARPSWQFMCEDVPVLERWDEILRQVQEGRLTA